jgi:hypothetical protein
LANQKVVHEIGLWELMYATVPLIHVDLNLFPSKFVANFYPICSLRIGGVH